jgi:hypothetical protein
MAGVRVRHPTAHDVRYTVVEKDKPYPVPYQCTPPAMGGCGSVHLFKTHHLNLDSTGGVLIGDVLFERIRNRLALDGFVMDGHVAKPPPVTLGVGVRSLERPGTQILHSPNN